MPRLPQPAAAPLPHSGCGGGGCHLHLVPCVCLSLQFLPWLPEKTPLTQPDWALTSNRTSGHGHPHGTASLSCPLSHMPLPLTVSEGAGQALGLAGRGSQPALHPSSLATRPILEGTRVPPPLPCPRGLRAVISTCGTNLGMG